MTSLLAWEPLQRKHIGDLNGFTSTYFKKTRDIRAWPPKGDAHRGWWEYEVQQILRDLRPSKTPGEIIRVGYDADGLGAVCVAQELDGPAIVQWEYGALALRLRRKGGGYADDMCRDLFDQLTARAVEADVSLVKIAAHIYEENRPSQNFVRRHGFRHTAAVGPQVQFWERDLLIATSNDD